MAQCYRNSGSLKNGMVAQAHRTSGSFAPRLFKYKREYRQKFLSAWKIAEFTKDWTSIAFYKEREKKYLS